MKLRWKQSSEEVSSHLITVLWQIREKNSVVVQIRLCSFILFFKFPLNSEYFYHLVWVLVMLVIKTTGTLWCISPNRKKLTCGIFLSILFLVVQNATTSFENIQQDFLQMHFFPLQIIRGFTLKRIWKFSSHESRERACARLEKPTK